LAGGGPAAQPGPGGAPGSVAAAGLLRRPDHRGDGAPDRGHPPGHRPGPGGGVTTAQPTPADPPPAIPTPADPPPAIPTPADPPPAVPAPGDAPPAGPAPGDAPPTDPAPGELITRLLALDVRFGAGDAGDLWYDAPPGVVTDELRDELRRSKPALLAWLAAGGDAVVVDRTLPPYNQQDLWARAAGSPFPAVYTI